LKGVVFSQKLGGNSKPFLLLSRAKEEECKQRLETSEPQTQHLDKATRWILLRAQRGIRREQCKNGAYAGGFQQIHHRHHYGSRV